MTAWPASSAPARAIDVRMARVVEHLVDRAERRELAVVEHRDAVGGASQHRQVVADDERRERVVLAVAQLADELGDRVAHGEVDARPWARRR